MGFMAGFGSSFSRSFEAGMERNAKRKDDLFKITYSDFIDRRNQIDEYKREDAKAARKAEALIEQSGVDPRAYPFVYKQVQAGVDESTLVNDLRTGQFKFDEEKTDQEPDPTGEQMSESGMAPADPAAAQVPAAPAETAAPQGAFGGIFGDFLNKKGANDRRRSRAMDQVAEVAGISPEEVQSTLDGSGYTSPEMDTSGIEFTPAGSARDPDPINTLKTANIERQEAYASGDPKRIQTAERRYNAILAAETIEAELGARENGVSLDGAPASIYDNEGKYVRPARVKRGPDGTYVDMLTNEPVEGNVVPRDKIETQLLEKINTSLKEPMSEQTGRLSAALSSVQTYNTMAEIVEKTNGAVLAPVTSGTYQFVQKWVQDATVGVEQLNKSLAAGDIEAIEQSGYSLESLQELKDQLVQQGGNDLGTQKGLFEVQKAIMAYQLGAAMGQDGRSLAEAERKLFTDMAAGGVTPDRFHQGMADILINNMRALDRQTEMIVNNDMNVKQYVQDYQHLPDHVATEPLMSRVIGSTDPEIQAAWKRLAPYDRRSKMPERTSGAPEETVEADIPVMNSIEEAMKLPSGTKFKTPDGRVKVRP